MTVTVAFPSASETVTSSTDNPPSTSTMDTVSVVGDPREPNEGLLTVTVNVSKVASSIPSVVTVAGIPAVVDRAETVAVPSTPVKSTPLVAVPLENT